MKVLFDVTCNISAYLRDGFNNGTTRVATEGFHHLKQRVTIESVVGLSWHSFDLYLKNAPQNELENLRYPFWRYLFYRLFKKSSASPVPDKYWINSDIAYFPALIYPLPELLKGRKPFLFVHDLFPVLYPEDYGDDFKQLQEYQFLMKDWCRYGWFCCNSEYTKTTLCECFEVDQNKVTVVPLAADKKLFYPSTDNSIREKLGFPEGNYILALSRFRRRKNLIVLIRAFEKLIREEKISDLSLILAGCGNVSSVLFNDDITVKKCFELSQDPLFKERIHIIGSVSEEDLAPLYSNAMMFVYPSLYEGFGLPPLEAMECGVPVITTNTTALPEVVGDAGITFDPNDVDELCSKLLKLYLDGNLRQSMSQKGLERAQQFTWDRHADMLVGAFERAL